MKFSAVVTRYFSFTGLSQNNPKWEGSEEVSSSIASAPRSLSHAMRGGPLSPVPQEKGTSIQPHASEQLPEAPLASREVQLPQGKGGMELPALRAER